MQAHVPHRRRVCIAGHQLLLRKLFLRQEQTRLRPAAVRLLRQLPGVVVGVAVGVHDGVRCLKRLRRPELLKLLAAQGGEPRHLCVVQGVYPDADAAKLDGRAGVGAESHTDAHSPFPLLQMVSRTSPAVMVPKYSGSGNCRSTSVSLYTSPSPRD